MPSLEDHGGSQAQRRGRVGAHRQPLCGVLWYVFKHLCTMALLLGAVSRLHCRQWGQHKGCDLSIKVNTVPFTQSIL